MINHREYSLIDRDKCCLITLKDFRWYQCLPPSHRQRKISSDLLPIFLLLVILPRWCLLLELFSLTKIVCFPYYVLCCWPALTVTLPVTRVKETHSFCGDSLWYNFPAVAALRLLTTQAIVRPVRRTKTSRIHLLFYDRKKCHPWSISISLIFSSLTGWADAVSYR